MPNETPSPSPPMPPRPRAPPRPREYSRTVLFFILLLAWLLLYPDSPASLLTAHEIAVDRLTSQTAALKVLNSTIWGNFTPVASNGGTPEDGAPGSGDDVEDDGGVGAALGFMNLTGFRKMDGLAWDDLDAFRDKSVGLSHAAIPPVDGEDVWKIGKGEHLWQNVSGHVHGTWVRRDASVSRQATSYNLTAATPAIAWSGAELPWSRNVTGREGRLKVHIHDKANDFDADELNSGSIYDTNMVRVEVTVDDTTGTGNIWNMRLHGVHWRRQGALLLTTTSEKFDGIFALPHLSPGPGFFSSSQRLLNATITKKLKEKARFLSIDARIPWTSEIQDSDLYSPSPHCEYVMYAQVQPLDRRQLNLGSFEPETDTMEGVIREIENELRAPLGRPVRGYPDLGLSAVLYSPDCAFFLETKGPPEFPRPEGRHLSGVKAEIYRSSLNTCILVYAMVFAGQIYLLRQQIRESSTPSTMGRVSLYTGAIMIMADALLVTSVMVFMLSSESSSLQSLTLMFSAFLSMLIAATFLYQVFEVQQQEWTRRRDRAAAQDASSGAALSAPPSQEQGLPRPATAPPERPPSPPIIVPSDQDIDAEISEIANAASAVPTAAGRTPQNPTPTFSALMTRVALATFSLFFLLAASTAWYKPARSALINLLVFAYLSLWTPQIYRNVQRNCRRALSWRFVLGQSVLRLVPVAYFYCREDNVLFVQTDRQAFLALAGWVWAQLWVLGFQDVLGPRFAVPRAWVPEAWDYHPVLREDCLEAGRFPIVALSPHAEHPSSPGGTPLASPSLEGGRKGKSGVRVVDCAICTEVLELPVLPAASSPSGGVSGGADADAGLGVAAVLGTRGYMVTPCRHVFHTQCLEGWMRFRLQCPICREDLPPL